MATDLKEYKELNCRDFRSDCNFTVRAETEEQVMKECELHACSAHGKCLISPRFKEKIKSRIKDVRV